MTKLGAKPRLLGTFDNKPTYAEAIYGSSVRAFVTLRPLVAQMSDTDTDDGHSLRYYEWKIRQRLHWPNDVPVPLHYIDFMIEIILGPQRVSSPHNLGNFRKWAKSASRNELLIALGLVIIDRHFSRNLRNEPVYVMLGDSRGAHVLEMRDRECTERLSLRSSDRLRRRLSAAGARA